MHSKIMKFTKVVSIAAYCTMGYGAYAQTPPDSIPTVSLDNVARHGFFYAGGEYVGDAGQETMGGAMYVEVMVPKEIQHPYPVVFLHGAGQT